MKALALNSIFRLIIAMGSLILLLSLFSTGVKPAGEWIYCNIYFKLTAFFTHSSPPDFCKVEKKAETIEIEERDNKKFSRMLLSYIVSCWKSAEIKGLYKDHPCYELLLKSVVDNVTEKNVTDILIIEDNCISIENSDYGCGEENKILWKIETNITDPITQENITDAINSVTRPEKIPIESQWVPEEIKTIKNTTFLKNYLKKEFLDKLSEELSNNYPGSNIGITEENGIVNITINNKEYIYDIEDVLSELEKSGKFLRAINSQSLILIRYNGDRDAVEVIG